MTALRETIPDEPRLLARKAILAISEEPPAEFLTIADAPYAIAPSEFSFDSFTSAASAAVQEDIKLNKIIYKLVPRKVSEEEFWRLYFSKVLYIIDSVKEHGVYPPPPPPPPPPPAAAPTADEAFAARTPKKATTVSTILLSNPNETCLVM